MYTTCIQCIYKTYPQVKGFSVLDFGIIGRSVWCKYYRQK